MIAFSIDNLKDFTSHLLLKDTFDSFSFIEGEIVTYNTFRIDGFIQKDFFDTGTELPEYSYWKNVRDHCFSVIRGKRTPLSFRFVFSLSRKNINRLVEQSAPSVDPADVQGLYLNIHFENGRLSCITGTSFRTFTLDKTLEHVWDEYAEQFFIRKMIDFNKEI